MSLQKWQQKYDELAYQFTMGKGYLYILYKHNNHKLI